MEDEGEWSCELEEYRWGHLVRGYKASQSKTITVKPPTQKETNFTKSTTEADYLLDNEDLFEFGRDIDFVEETTPRHHVNGVEKENRSIATILAVIDTVPHVNSSHNLDRNLGVGKGKRNIFKSTI